VRKVKLDSALGLQEVKKFAKLLGMECTAVFGGSGVANQISELKRGSEVGEGACATTHAVHQQHSMPLHAF
jgi:hypothetical protein